MLKIQIIRQVRIANLIKKILTNNMLKNNILLTITKVLINKDFKIIQVFLDLQNHSKEEKILSYLDKNTIYFRKILSKSNILKYTPKIQFKTDLNIKKLYLIKNL